MPEIEKIEDTPNPNAKKFVLKEPLTFGITYSFEDAQQAQDDALATELFRIGHITSVLYVDNWLTVTQDGGSSWGDLTRKVTAQIESAPVADVQIRTIDGIAPTAALLSQDQQQRFVDINILIDKQIRPVLQGDGGDLQVVSLNGNELSIHLWLLS